MCRRISRNGNEFESFPVLSKNLPTELRARSAILDGEIVALDRHGNTQFKDLLIPAWRAPAICLRFALG